MLIKDFKYKGLMRFFEEISAIPRPTYHEERIVEYLCDFARVRGLEYYSDSANNVFIKKAGSVGRENEPALMLQGHTDMVCEKNEDTEHDFLSEGIELYESDGWLRAKGTTLGADDGVAVAVMLYVLDGAEGQLRSHPPIECLFTASEEVGMDGVLGFNYSRASARRMINMDNSDERQIITGCAGGCNTSLVYAFDTEKPCAEGVEITVKGLFGGHSGEDIDKGRANANKLIGRILLDVSQRFDIRLALVNGGSKSNAITREARALVTTADPKALIEYIGELEVQIGAELVADDSGFALVAEKCATPDRVMSKKSGESVIFFLATVQNGIFEMNKNVRTLVEFSRNLGIVDTKQGEISFIFLSRSLQNAQLEMSKKQLEAYADMLGMKVEHGNYYPGWSYSELSPLRDTYAEVYKALYGRDVEIATIHAGLECGIIKEKLPDMDIISCGPMVTSLHSPDEAMEIASFERFFTIIKNVIEK